MPYKVFSAGEEALASDANSYLMSQTVPRFTNAAQRSSQLSAPVLNQLSILDSRPGLVQYWTGSAWADVLAGAPLVQAMQGSLVIDGNSSAGVTFPLPFAAAPTVVATHQFTPLAQDTQISVNSTSTTGAYLRFRNGSGVLLPINTTVYYGILAVGPRP